MRVETVHGRHLLCGVILNLSMLKVGQVWAPASGGNSEVKIGEIKDEWITYEGALQPRHEKHHFSFQCRYCLVLDTPEIPKEFQQ